MTGMQERHWVVLVSPERFADERLYAYESITVPAAPGEAAEPGNHVALLVGTDPPGLFGLGRVVGFRYDGAVPTEMTIRYTHRVFDEPIPVDGPALEPGVSALAPEAFDRLAGGVSADRRVDADKANWLVSLALPIEAASPAEAVREFWTYVARLGPRELPAFVWPTDDELAMQAFVLGEPTNLDPEEDG